jgi:two-component sensor histidine kinase
VCLLFWVPLVAVGLDFLFDGETDLRHLARTIAIADTVTLLCYGGTLLGHTIVERIARRFGSPLEQRGSAFYFAISILLMPCALPVGLWVGARVGAALHQPYHPNAARYRISLGFGAITAALFFFQRARAEAREKQDRAESRVRDLENANLRAQLSALTAEMNPHMLFNALNTIASLVHGDPNLAEETVLELAELYRGILKTSGQTMHSLRDELRVCEAYLRVERARFGDRLKVEVSIEDNLDVDALSVPVLILQPLVENAIKHGIAPRARGGSISIRVAAAEDGTAIAIEDDGVGFGRSVVPGNGRAIANCADRLRLAYGGAAAIEIATRAEGGTRARLQLPPRATA